jgi:aminopeptidase N
LNKTFYHQTVTTKQVEDYISQQSKMDFKPVFDQYLRTTQIPILQHEITGRVIRYRWTNCIPGFNLPVKVNGQWIKPITQWQQLNIRADEEPRFDVDPNLFLKQG